MLIVPTVHAQTDSPFVSTWLVGAGESITIPTNPGFTNYDYTVDWGDNSTSAETGNATHRYEDADTYTISISGTFPAIYFNNSGDRDKIRTIKQWGTNPWLSMENAFNGCTNLDIEGGAGNPDLSGVTNMFGMFVNADAFNQDIGDWDVSSVTNMFGMFTNAVAFNQDIGDWDVSSVTNMFGMFSNAVAFNQDLSDWDVSSVTNMTQMFVNVQLSTANYDSLLVGWSTIDSDESSLQRNVSFGGGSNRYCAAGEIARRVLTVDNRWIIANTDGLDTSENCAMVAFTGPGSIADQTYKVGNNVNFILPRAALGTPDYTYTLTGSIPTGLEFDEDTRALTGRPTETTTVELVYTVTDSGTPTSINTMRFNLAIADPTPPTVVSVAFYKTITDADTDTGFITESFINEPVYAVIQFSDDIQNENTILADGVTPFMRGSPTIQHRHSSQTSIANPDGITTTTMSIIAYDADFGVGDQQCRAASAINTSRYLCQIMPLASAGYQAGPMQIVVPVDEYTRNFADNRLEDDYISPNSLTLLEPEVPTVSSVVHYPNTVTAQAGNSPISTTWESHDPIYSVIQFGGTINIIPPDISGFTEVPDARPQIFSQIGSAERVQFGYVSSTEFPTPPAGYCGLLAAEADDRNPSFLCSYAPPSGTMGVYKIIVGTGTESAATVPVPLAQEYNADTGIMLNIPAAELSIADVSVEEADGTATVTVELTGNIVNGFTVDISTGGIDDSAVSGEDYIASSETLTFIGIHDETQTFDVIILTDGRNEGDETLTVSLDNLQGTTATVILNDPTTITIIDSIPAPNLFITTWAVGDANFGDGDLSITIPTNLDFRSSYSYTVNWGDNSTSAETGNATHNYATPGIYTVSISGTFPAIYFNRRGDRDKIQTIRQWGTNPWLSMEKAFSGCNNLDIEGGAGNPVLSGVTNMLGMFANSGTFNSDISDWDVSSVTNMFGMFTNSGAFNQDISDWDISSVTNMSFMFENSDAFNQDLSGWDVSSVTEMTRMFNKNKLSTANYDSLLVGWSTIDSDESSLQQGVSFHGGNSKYCTAGEIARRVLTDDNGWIIAGTDGLDTSENCAIVTFTGSGSIADQTYNVGDNVNFILPRAALGTPDYNYRLTGNIPTGLEFNADTRTLTGIPTETTAVELIYTVTDAMDATDTLLLNITIIDTTLPTVTLVTFYTSAEAAAADASFITEARLNETIYAVIQFSENMDNSNTAFDPNLRGRPTIQHRYNTMADFITRPIHIIAHDADFTDGINHCRAVTAADTSRYLCQISPIAAFGYEAGPMQIVVPRDDYTTDLVGNRLRETYISTNSLTILLAGPPTVESVIHYPSTVTAQAGSSPISTWESHDPIYSVIQFEGTVNIIPPAISGFTEIPDARPQIFSQIGLAERVQFGYASSTEFPTPPAGYCGLLDIQLGDRNPSFWCSYAPPSYVPPSDPMGVYKIIVGTGTESLMGVPLAAEYNADTGVMLSASTAVLSITDVSVDETDGTATVSVQLTGNVVNGFTVDISTTDGSAVAGEDYIASNETLTFTGTHDETQTFDVTILTDVRNEGEETLTVSLDNLQGTSAAVMLSDPATITIFDISSPIVESVVFYASIVAAETNAAASSITAAIINETIYTVIQFSENMDNSNTGFDPDPRGRPTIQYRYNTIAEVATTPIHIIAYDTDFTENVNHCRAVSATDTSRYLCQISLLASFGYEEGPLQIVVPRDDYTTDLAGNRLRETYISPNSLTLLERPTVESVIHYPNTATAQAGSGPISTWESHNPIYSVIQFEGTVNIIPPDMSGFTEVPDARPQIFSQIGLAERVQFGYASSTEFPTPPVGYCGLLAAEADDRNPSFWCSYAPPSGTMDVYKIIVGTGTESLMGVPLAAEYNSDTGVMLNASTATLSIADVSVEETDNTATVSVQLTGNVVNGFTIDISTTDGSAVAGEDYIASNETLTFTGTHDETQTFDVIILTDSRNEGDETLTVSLDNLQGTSAQVILSDPTTITIIDSIPPTVESVIHYPSAATASSSPISTWESHDPIYSVIQFNGTVDRPFLSDDESEGLVETPASPQIFFQIGSAERMQFGYVSSTEFPTPPAGYCGLLAAEADDRNPSFLCSYAPPSGTMGVYKIIVGTGTESLMGVPLAEEYDDDPGIILNIPTAELSMMDVSVEEADGAATVSVQLTGNVIGGFMVDISTGGIDDSAVAGEDYIASSETLIFTGIHGETQTFDVIILTDSSNEEDETLTVSLSKLQNTTATVILNDPTTITIIDSTPAPNLFITTWAVGDANFGDSDLSITIPTNPGFTNYDYTVDWGDNSTSAETGNATHIYATPGIYTVSISGTFPAIYFSNGGDRDKIQTIRQWGTNPWATMARAFWGCANLTIETDAGNPDLSGVADMSQMFKNAFAFNSDISDWDVSRVTNMSQMFIGAIVFNGDLSDWDVSRVTDMSRMFESAIVFNGDLFDWDVGSVTDMTRMFWRAEAFNSDISDWDVSSVTDMTRMFELATVFNGDLSDWDVSNVMDMTGMFNSVTLSTANYEALLVGWSMIDSLQMGVSFDGGNSKYCTAGEIARRVLTDDNGWIIAGTDGLDTSENCAMLTFAGSGSIADQTYNIGDNVNFILPRAALGTPDYTYTLTGSIPTGLEFDADTRALTGRPTRTTTAELVYTVTDSGTPTSINTMRFNLAIVDPTPPTVVSVVFYKTITDADTDTGFITESFINEPVYVVIQFSEDIQNENTILAEGVTPFMRGSPTIQHRHRSQTSIANPDGITTTTMSIIAYDADFGVGDQQCRAASATNTSRYLCQIIPLASAGYQAGPMQIVVPVDEYTRDFVDSRLEDDYISNSLTLLEPEVPTVSSVMHYPSTVTAQVGSSPISTTWTSRDPIYSVIQFEGTVNIIPPDMSGFTEVPDARPQIFSQIGLAERVQFGYASNTAFSMPPAGYCSLLAAEAEGRNPTFWCSYAPPSGTMGVYKIIVGTGTESAATVPVPLAQEYNADTGIMLNVPAAELSMMDVSVAETDGTATVTVELTSNVIGGFMVDISTGGIDDSAVAGEDYIASSETLTFIGTHLETQTFDVTILADSMTEGDRTLTVSLDNLQGTSAPVVLSDIATITITDITPFVSTWLVGAGESITIPTNPAFTYDYTVDWGDNSTSAETGDATHRYEDADTYTISISGTFPAIYFNNGGDRDKIRTIKQWGTNPWLSMESAFRGCTNLDIEGGAGNPDLSKVTDMSSMFGSVRVFNQDISGWDVSRVTNMRRTFSGAFSFNQDLSGWDVSRVTDMFQMFNNARVFNQDISGWDVSSVTNMIEMFWDARAFNQDLSDWDVSSARFMAQMFLNVQLSTANYDSLLVGWSTIDSDESSLQQNVRFGGGSNRYCAAGEIARRVLTDDNGWIIANTDGLDTSENCAMVAFTGSGSIADQTYNVGDNVNFILPRAALGTPDYTYTLTGSIPTGLEFDEDTRALTGRPTRYTTTVELVYTVTDSGTPTSINTMRFNLAIADPTPPTVVSAAFYKTITDADTDTGFITESFINEPVYAVIQFSEDIQNENTILADGVTSFMRGSPTIQHRHRSQTSIANPDGITTTTMSIIAYDADFGVGDQQCRAASATNTSRYLCQIIPLAAFGYEAGPMQIVVPVDEYTRDFADNRLEDDYISPNSLTLLEPEVPTVSSVVHYPSTVTAQAGSNPISTTWESRDPIYSVIQFGGTINIIPPDMSGFTEVPDARPQIFSQIGSAERVQFGYASSTEFSMPPAGYCSLLAEEPGGRNPSFLCSYAPPSGTMGVYKIIVGTGTESAATVPVPLAQEYNADTGIMLNIPAAFTIEAEPGMFELIEGQNTNIDVSLSRIDSGTVEVSYSMSGDTTGVSVEPLSPQMFSSTNPRTFTVTVDDDNVYTGDRRVELTFMATGYTPKTVTVDITEDERSIELAIDGTPETTLPRFAERTLTVDVDEISGGGLSDISLDVETTGAVTLADGIDTFDLAGGMSQASRDIVILGNDIGAGTVTFTVSSNNADDTLVFDALVVELTVSTPTLEISAVSPSVINLLTSETTNLEVTVSASGDHNPDVTVAGTVVPGSDAIIAMPLEDTSGSADMPVIFTVGSTNTPGNATITITVSHPLYYDSVGTDVAVNVSLRDIGLSVDPSALNVDSELDIVPGMNKDLTIDATATADVEIAVESNMTDIASVDPADFTLVAGDRGTINVSGVALGNAQLTIEASAEGYSTETVTVPVNVQDELSIETDKDTVPVTEGMGADINVNLNQINGGPVEVFYTMSGDIAGVSVAPLSPQMFSTTATQTFTVTVDDDSAYTGDRSVELTFSAAGYTPKTVTVNIEEDERSIGLTAVGVPVTTLLRFATSTLTVRVNEVSDGMLSGVMLNVGTEGAVRLEDGAPDSFDLTGEGTSAEREIVILGNGIGAGTVTFTVSSNNADDTLVFDPLVVALTVNTPTLVISAVSPRAINLDTSDMTNLAVTISAAGSPDATVTVMGQVTGGDPNIVTSLADTTGPANMPVMFTVGSSNTAGNATLTITVSHDEYNPARVDVAVNVSLRDIGLSVDPSALNVDSELDIVLGMNKDLTIDATANADVEITVESNMTGIASVASSAGFTLAAGNSGTINVTGVALGNAQLTIEASAEGYSTETETVPVNVLDTLRIEVAPMRDLDLTEGMKTTIGVSLSRIGIGESVTVDIAATNGTIDGSERGLSVTPISITFTDEAEQSVTVTAVNDNVYTPGGPREVQFSLTDSAGNYMEETVTVDIREDERSIGLTAVGVPVTTLLRFATSTLTVRVNEVSDGMLSGVMLNVGTEGAVRLEDGAPDSFDLTGEGTSAEREIVILSNGIGAGTVTFTVDSSDNLVFDPLVVALTVNTPTLVISAVSPSAINLGTSEMANLDVRVNAIGNHAATITATVIGGVEVTVDDPPIRAGVANDTSVRFVVRSGITNENPTIRITASHPNYRSASTEVAVSVFLPVGLIVTPSTEEFVVEGTWPLTIEVGASTDVSITIMSASTAIARVLDPAMRFTLTGGVGNSTTIDIIGNGIGETSLTITASADGYADETRTVDVDVLSRFRITAVPDVFNLMEGTDRQIEIHLSLIESPDAITVSIVATGDIRVIDGTSPLSSLTFPTTKIQSITVEAIDDEGYEAGRTAIVTLTAEGYTTEIVTVDIMEDERFITLTIDEGTDIELLRFGQTPLTVQVGSSDGMLSGVMLNVATTGTVTLAGGSISTSLALSDGDTSAQIEISSDSIGTGMVTFTAVGDRVVSDPVAVSVTVSTPSLVISQVSNNNIMLLTDETTVVSVVVVAEAGTPDNVALTVTVTGDDVLTVSEPMMTNSEFMFGVGSGLEAGSATVEITASHEDYISSASTELAVSVSLQTIGLDVDSPDNLSLVRFTNEQIDVMVTVAADLTVETEGAVSLSEAGNMSSATYSLTDEGSTQVTIYAVDEDQGTVRFTVSGAGKTTETRVLNVQVTRPMLEISAVSDVAIELAARTTEELTIEVNAVGNHNVTLTAVVSDRAVASVMPAERTNVSTDTSATFTVRGLDEGMATITLIATHPDYNLASTEIEVNVFLPPVGLIVTPSTEEFVVEGTWPLTIAVSESTDVSITIMSASPNIAGVPASAMRFTLTGGVGDSTTIDIIGNAIGVTTLTITASADGYADETEIIDVDVLSRFRITAVPDVFNLMEGTTKQIEVRVSLIEITTLTVTVGIVATGDIRVTDGTNLLSNLTFTTTETQSITVEAIDDEGYEAGRTAIVTLTAEGYTPEIVTVTIIEDERFITLDRDEGTDIELLRFGQTPLTVQVDSSDDNLSGVTLNVATTGVVTLAGGSNSTSIALSDEQTSTQIEIASDSIGTGTVTFTAVGDRVVSEPLVVNVMVSTPTLVISEVSNNNIMLLTRDTTEVRVVVGEVAIAPEAVTLTATVAGVDMLTVSEPELVMTDSGFMFVVDSGLEAGTATITITASHPNYRSASTELPVSVSLRQIGLSVPSSPLDIGFERSRRLIIQVNAEVATQATLTASVASTSIISITEPEMPISLTDNQIAGREDISITVSSGDALGTSDLVIRVEADGYEPATRTITVNVAEVTDLRFRIKVFLEGAQ